MTDTPIDVTQDPVARTYERVASMALNARYRGDQAEVEKFEAVATAIRAAFPEVVAAVEEFFEV